MQIQDISGGPSIAERTFLLGLQPTRFKLDVFFFVFFSMFVNYKLERLWNFGIIGRIFKDSLKKTGFLGL